MSAIDHDAFFSPANPELHALRRRISAETLGPGVKRAALAHLAAPMTSSTELAVAVGAACDEVRASYRFVHNNPEVQAFVRSLFYPHRLWTAFATRTVAEWLADPTRADRLLAGQPVLASTVELDPSRGTCGYRCTMCLWSDKDELTYATRDLRADGLLTADDWCRILDELHAGGTRRVVVSGGGEALLNPELPTIMRHARTLGLAVHLYTTGFDLPPARTQLWEELLGLAQVRFSIHSPHPDTYDAITGLPARIGALDHVTEHIARLLDLRRGDAGPRVGIGFVAQPLNCDQLLAMADYAARLGVDYLDVRKDEVDVTDGLTTARLDTLRRQLRAVRATAVASGYGRLRVDLGDELVAIANSQPIVRRRTPECLVKHFRPTISPFGILAPCDLKAEPRFADSAFNLGVMTRQSLGELVAALAERFVPDRCAQCMPSSRTGNGVYRSAISVRG
ncbi:MAG: radical SAM protein [Egibacteraceae bacterium]